MPFVIEPLSPDHHRASFNCGEDSLNIFLQKYARQNDKRGLGRTYVAVAASELEVKGYYTISSGAVTFDRIPKRLPRYPVPVAHLGRLAVDRSVQGQGLGEYLLIDALRRAVRVSKELGLYAVAVRALNEVAKRFYLKYGFTTLLDDEYHLYLPIKTIKQLTL